MKLFKMISIFLILTRSLVASPTIHELYLDLMKRCLVNSIYEDNALYTDLYGHDIARYDGLARQEGLDHPRVAHTMIGMKRLNNIQSCLEDVIAHNVEGDVIETGVWRGGATIFMRAILKAHDITNRKVWVADSFEGLPAPDEVKYPQDQEMRLHLVSHLAVSLEQVKDNFKKYNLLDDQVCFLKGWFKDTLPTAPIKKLAILRLDGDLYESTMQALIALYDKVSIGGYIIIDDFAIQACNQAVHDFRAERNITQQLIPIDTCTVYWQKTE